MTGLAGSKSLSGFSLGSNSARGLLVVKYLFNSEKPMKRRPSSLEKDAEYCMDSSFVA
jgi:hypothetical protein